MLAERKGRLGPLGEAFIVKTVAGLLGFVRYVRAGAVWSLGLAVVQVATTLSVAVNDGTAHLAPCCLDSRRSSASEERTGRSISGWRGPMRMSMEKSPRMELQGRATVARMTSEPLSVWSGTIHSCVVVGLVRKSHKRACHDWLSTRPDWLSALSISI